MARGIRKAIVNNNPKTRWISVSVDGSAVTPEAMGMDKSQIKEVIDNGAGNYTLILKYPFNLENKEAPMSLAGSLDNGIGARVVATAHDRVTVETFDTATKAATDGAFTVMMHGNDGKINY